MYGPVFHITELVVASSLLYVIFFAIKKFKLLLLKRGLYVIELGASLIVLVEIIELSFPQFGENPVMSLIIYTLDLMVMICFAIGIIILSKSIEKILGK